MFNQFLFSRYYELIILFGQENNVDVYLAWSSVQMKKYNTYFMVCL